MRGRSPSLSSLKFKKTPEGVTAVVIGALWPVGGGKGSEGSKWGGSVEDGGGAVYMKNR